MKEKIVYTVSFLLAFVIVTGLLIYANSIFKNIFAFDFSPAQANTAEVKKAEEPAPAPAQTQMKDSTDLKLAQLDSVKKSQDTTNIASSSITLGDSNAVKKVNKKLEEAAKKMTAAQPSAETPQQKPEVAYKNTAKGDSTYKAWVASTVKLYESMDTRKAAKIILGYSDNIARDILMKMKKKKAAEIIAEFKPEIATRIISSAQ